MNILILIFNIVGTFLLSVEAIKLENLEKCQAFLRHSNANLNPEIPWEGSNKENVLSEVGFSGFLLKILAIFFVPSFILTYLFLHKVIEMYGLFLIAIFDSYILWTILIILIEITIKILKNIVKHTERGMIGLIGFIILLASFLTQYFSSKN